MALTNDQQQKVQAQDNDSKLDQSSGPRVPHDTEVGLKVHQLLSAVKSGRVRDMVSSAVDLINDGTPSELYSSTIDALNSCLSSNTIPANAADPNDSATAISSEQAGNLIGLAATLESSYGGADRAEKQVAAYQSLAKQASIGVATQDTERLEVSLNAISHRLTSVPNATKIPPGTPVPVPAEALPQVANALMDVLRSKDVSEDAQRAARRLVQGIDKNALVDSVKREERAGNYEGMQASLRLLRGMASSKSAHAEPAQQALESLANRLSKVINTKEVPESVREFAAKAIVDIGPAAFKHAHALIGSAKNKLTSTTAVRRLLRTDPETLSPEHFSPEAVKMLGEFVSYKFVVSGNHPKPEELIATTREQGLKILQRAGQQSIAALPGLEQGLEKKRISLGQVMGAMKPAAQSSEAPSPSVMKSAYSSIMNMLTREFTAGRNVPGNERQSVIESAKATFGLLSAKSVDLLKDNGAPLFSAAKQGYLPGNILGGLVHYAAGKLDKEVISEVFPEGGYDPERSDMEPAAERTYRAAATRALENLGPEGVNDLFDRLPATYEAHEKSMILTALAKYPDYLPGSENPSPAEAAKIAAAEQVVERMQEFIDYLPESKEAVSATSVALMEALKEYSGDGLSASELREQLTRIDAAQQAVNELVQDLSRDAEPDFLDDPNLQRSLASRIEEFTQLYGDPSSYTPETFREMEAEAREASSEDRASELSRISDIKTKLRVLAYHQSQLYSYEKLANNLSNLYDRVDETLMYAPIDGQDNLDDAPAA